ncbi:MAG: hypothetical protein P8I91_09950 [Phycisphaerales bacterium]|nr:hypothetical protein [Phycisphaerales bacterium]
MRIVVLAGGLVTTVLMALAVVTPTEAATAPTPTREVASPLGLTTNAADYLDAPAKAMVLRLDQSVVDSLWGVESVLMREVVLPTGAPVDLDLVRVNNPIESTWLIAADAFGQAEKVFVPAADVILLSGSVVGQPDRRAFIGLSNGQAQGWIETDDGMHMISTPAGGGPTLMYLVGSKRGGIDIPPPPPAESGLVKATPESGLVAKASPVFEPATDADRILVEIADPDSPIHGSMSAETVLRLLDFPLRAAGGSAIEIVDLEYGACCLTAGLCVQATINECRFYCDGDDMDGFCGNAYDPDDDSIPPPCWLGAGVPCDEQWVCYEAAEQGPDDPDDAPWIGNWTGACCFPDPDNIGQTLFEDKVACECAMLGGSFVAVPAFCLGEYQPSQTPAENFVSVEELEDLVEPGVDFCSLPAGACCVEQNVICASLLEGEDEVLQEFFERIGCLYIPQIMCEDADIITDTFSGTGGPGLFIKECFPCSYDVIGPSDAFLCAVEVPTNGVAPLAPKGVRCQTPRIVIDTDTWYLERFNGDIGAAQAYATLLMAATTFIFERDSLVSLQVGELLLRGVPVLDENGDPIMTDIINPYLPGACCTNGMCIENMSYGDCTGAFVLGEWQGPGSSCWGESTACNGDPIDPGDPRPWTINGTLSNMNVEWGLGGSAAALDIDYDMVLLLSGFPYVEPYENESEWGVIPQGVASGGGTMCNSALNPFAVAAVQGSFPYPGNSFDAYDVNWDPVMVSQAIAITIGVSVTRSYGYDRCLGLPCEYGADATPDCDFQNALPGYADGQMPPTIMSNCYLCEGGTSNFQLRFRSEIAARLYARLGNLDCAASGSETAGPHEVEDPTDPTLMIMVPLAADDTFRVYGIQAQYFDVLLNDVAIGCSSEVNGTLALTELNDQVGPVVTPQGGVVLIAPDPITGEDVVLYTPPPGGLCGLDYFEYTIESPDPDNDGLIGSATGIVRLLRQPEAGNLTIEAVPWIDCMPGACCVDDGSPSGVCVDMAEVLCVADGGTWQGAGTACGDVGIPCPPAGTVNACLDLVAQATWPQSITSPPFVATPPSLPVDPCRLDMLQVDVLNPSDPVFALTWDGLIAQIVDTSATQPQELLMRFWFAGSPGGLPSEFVDVRPFADPAITTACGPLVSPPVVGNLVGPSTGQCELLSPLYVPTENGVTAIPVQLLVDQDDVPGADACWLEGSVTTFAGDDGGFGAVQSLGACCIGGLCIETNPFDCLALSGFDLADAYWADDTDPFNDPDPDGGEHVWVRTAVSSGFFMGVGTTCDEADWCRPTAPCCYDDAGGERACERLTGDDCWLVGIALGNDASDYAIDWGTISIEGDRFVDATTLDGDSWNDSGFSLFDEPAWGLDCDFPVCFTHEHLATIASCCVRTDNDTFCTDLTKEDCDAFATITGWSTSWSIRGKCVDVPCSEYGGTPWSAPRGACCYQIDGQSASCDDDLTFDECMDTYLTPDIVADSRNWVTFRAGESCGTTDCEMQNPPTALGACCISLDDFCCVELITRDVCQTLGGSWLGESSTCVSCVPRTVDVGVCCILGLACTSDLNPIRCAAVGGTWYRKFMSCNEGLPCYGSTQVGTLGACCYEYQCVDATTPGLEDITEADCLLGGGRWLGIGLCNGNPNDPNVFPAGACDPVECLNVDGLTTYNVETFDATTCIRFGGEPLVLLGDVNGDGRVGGMTDLLPLINQWGQPSMDADFDGSGMVDVRDLLILFVHWE